MGAFIRQWVFAYTGSDTIHLDKKMNLWAIVKQNLDIRPDEGENVAEKDEYIFIELLDSGGTLTYCHPCGKEIYMHTIYRCYISSAGQQAITRYLENQFRNSFRVYMTARFSDDSNEKIRHAIGSFLADYNLPMDDIIMGRLSKDWYRFRQKHKENYPIPIFF